MSRIGCPDVDLILPALEGTLPDPARGLVRAHLAACSLCTELAEALANAADAPTGEEASRIARAIAVSRRRYPVHTWLGFAAAAAVCILGGGAYVALRDQPTVAPPVNRPAPVVADRAPRPLILALAAPAIELPPESLTLRSEARSSYAAALERGLQFYQRGDYRIAAARLERVVRAHPRRPHAQFYLGAALLMRGDAAAAVRPLEAARDLAGPGASLYPEATWYLAVALERSGRSAEALDPLVALCGAGGSRRDQACDGLSRLLNTR